MTVVFEFTAFRPPRSHRNRGMFPFQGLDAGHLVGRHHAFAYLKEGLGLQVQLGDIGEYLIGRLIGLSVEPIAASMRYELDLILKNDPPGARKWSRQCRV